VLRASIVGEKLGIPSVTVVVPMFYKLAQHVARSMGFSRLSLAQYPGGIENHSVEEVKANIASMFEGIVDAWTKPPQIVESASSVARTKEIVFKGSFNEINDFFYQKQWTDGLPIVPPTTASIEEMLRWTDIAPDQVIAVLPMANRNATPWTIAANAVMAGCSPEYMPVLIAAVEAFGDPNYQLKDIGSTSSIKPFIVVNGPIINLTASIKLCS